MVMKRLDPQRLLTRRMGPTEEAREISAFYLVALAALSLRRAADRLNEPCPHVDAHEYG